MPAQAHVAITVVDEVPGGGRREAFTLTLVSSRITARDLIERRVRHEVDEYNRKAPDSFYSLIQPTDAERLLNGWRLKQPRRIDADEQVAGAIAAFEQGRILLFVDDRQVAALDEAVTFHRDAEVCFYKLVPLVGG
jgi:hypothetical protein